MRRERIEETLLAIIAALLFFALFPVSIGTRIATAASIAIGLIALLLLRSADWHAGSATPFDGILLVGIAASIVHLATFLVSDPSIINSVLLIVAASFYAVMAALLARHRGWLFREAQH